MSKPRDGFIHTFGVAKYVYLSDYEKLEEGFNKLDADLAKAVEALKCIERDKYTGELAGEAYNDDHLYGSGKEELALKILKELGEL